MSLFKVAGVSTADGQTKVRFANDLVSRVKVLIKCDHTDIHLMELPNAMLKSEAVTYLKTTYLMETPLFAEAIDNADEKYNEVIKVSKFSLDAIRARAGIVLQKV